MMYEEMQEFQQLIKYLKEVFDKTADPRYAQARIVATLQVLVPHCMDVNSLRKLNIHLRDTVYHEMQEILAKEKESV
jgi:hypothetical protein